MVIDIKRLLIVALCVLGIYQLWQRWSDRPMTTSYGILAPNPPVQMPIKQANIINYDDYRLLPVASFNVKARLLSKHKYHLDASAAVSPIDLSVGWGNMSDQAVLNELKISQSNRFFYFRYQQTPPIAHDEITRSATNIHIIPANKRIEDKINDLRVGSVIELYGKLVNVSGDNFVWQTSTRRDDTGAGACEIMYVVAVN